MSTTIGREVFVTPAMLSMDYGQFVENLFKLDTDQIEFCHMAMGVSGEAGELCDALKKHAIYGKTLDRKNVVEELGDLRFYMQAVMNKLDITEEEILQGNADKLGERYKTGKYSDEQAIARADKLIDNPLSPAWGLTQEQSIPEFTHEQNAAAFFNDDTAKEDTK